MVLKLLLLLCLLNTTLKVLTSGELGCVHKRNKQGRFGKEISHLLKRAVGSLGEDCPKVNCVGKVADLGIVSRESKDTVASYPCDNDESPSSSAATIVGARRETSEKNSCDDEGDAVENIATDKRPASSCSVDEEHTQELGHESDDRGYHLVSEGFITLNTDLGIDGNRVVLNSAYSSHLRSDLDRDGKPKSSKA
ncbi:hypothetical protein HG531_004519 [Fusarium graminearum]|nr:hypothetical protein HG531_004519 [Fusarium graminearum]